MSAKFAIKSTKNGQFSFHLKAGNGEIILSSETYPHIEAAKRGVESVKANAPDDFRYERKTDKRGQPFFVLKAANHEIVGKSEMYSSTSAMENGIASVKKNAPGAPVVELTEASA
jgi:uncharacterized protein YegP (UPF0339 family)